MCESFATFVLILFQNIIKIHGVFLRCSETSKLDRQRHFEFVVYMKSCQPILILVYISRIQLFFYINFELELVKFLENDSLPKHTTWYKIYQGLRPLSEM